VSDRRWLGVVEGYYGPPLPQPARLDLIRWMGDHGFTCYGYAPKDDPYHRARWREPYPADRMAEFAAMLEVGDAAGVDVALVVSPGLDWRDGDEDELARKLVTFRDLGARVLGVAWDDVPAGGADLGHAHGNAVAVAADAVGAGVDWITCPTDYSGMEVTPYLRAYVDALPAGAEIMWCGPSIVSPHVSTEQIASYSRDLGRKVLFAENFPVNDGAMAGVLHLGPYPRRDEGVVEHATGVFCNLMSLPLASRIGLGVAARWWQEPAGDRETHWRETIDEVPGLLPLARSARSWVGATDLDPELEGWGDAAMAGDVAALRAYLFAGCRNGLPPELAAELDPWISQWDRETQAMQYALLLLEQDAKPSETAFILSELWSRARHSQLQLFGVRWAFYPVTERRGERFDVHPDALVEGDNLTDRLCRAAIRS
jgi:hypothetical protein